MVARSEIANSARMRYRNYLLSQAWREKRRLVLARAGHECEKCGGDDDLQVHHLTYERVFDERLADLQALCEGCHKLAHGKADAVSTFGADILIEYRPEGFRDSPDMDVLLDMEKERRAIIAGNSQHEL